MVFTRRSAAAQPKLPDLSGLGLARTGMEALGEDADAYAQYLVTSDFFISVLEQIENISDLTKACDVVKTWCGADQARNQACKSPAARQAWQSLCRKLFSPNVPEPSPDVSWMQHFTSLCNMDPVKRLLRIAMARAEKVEARLRAEMAEHDDQLFASTYLHDIQRHVVERLYVEAGLCEPREDDYPVAPTDRWTTERDNRVDVAVAMTQIARRRNAVHAPAVEKATIDAILHVVHVLSRKDGDMNDLAMERLGYLVGWLLFQNPPEPNLAPLRDVRNEIAGYLYLALVRTTWGHVRMDHNDAFRRTNVALNALKELANFKGAGFSWAEWATPPLDNPGTNVQTASNAMVHYLVHGNDSMKWHVCEIIAESLHMTVQQVGLGFPDTRRKGQFAMNLVTYGALEALSRAGINDPGLANKALRACASIARQLAMRR